MLNSKHYIYLLVLFSILALNACSFDGFDYDAFIESEKKKAEEELNKEVDAHFLLQLGKNNSLRSSVTLDGTADENKIKTLTFFVINLDGNDELDWTRVKQVSVLAPPDPTNVEVTIKTNIGRKHIYVGANMSAAQINSFCANRGKYTSTKNTYKDVVKDFTDPNQGFVMFGQIKTKEATPSSIIEIQGEEIIPVSVELKRVASKVALTYTQDAIRGEGYASIASGIGGFIDADSIHFMLNTTSKSIDFIQSTTPKYVMSDYIEEDTNPAHQTAYHYIKDPTQDFMLYTPQGAVPGVTGGSNFPTATVQLPIEIPAGSDNPYRQGLITPDGSIPNSYWHNYSSLYCLENTVSTSGFESHPNLKELRRGINTQVIVAAKYIPDEINHYIGGSMVPYHPTTLKPDRASIHTEMKTITNNDPNGPYTFYAVLIPDTDPARYNYYTYDAKVHMDAHDPKNFITYKGGYGYYSTFVSQSKPMEEDKYYNLKRNNYYILNVEKFIPPGAVYPQQLYMLVNSQTIEWSFQKTIDVPLD